MRRGADLILEAREMAADGGQRHAEAAAGRRQAARLGNGYEQADGGEPVHGTIPKMEGYLRFLYDYCR